MTENKMTENKMTERQNDSKENDCRQTEEILQPSLMFEEAQESTCSMEHLVPML